MRYHIVTFDIVLKFASRVQQPPLSSEPSTDNMFLACSSQLEEFFIGPDEVNPWADSKPFVKCAQNYKLSGGSLDALCEINARVADSANRPQVAETWRMLRLLVMSPLDMLDFDLDADVNDDDGGGARSLDVDLVHRGASAMHNNEDIGFGRSRATTADSSLRHDQGAAGGSDHHAGGARKGSSSLQSDRRGSRGKTSSAESKMMENNNGMSEEEDVEGDYAENELTLTNIASGQMLTGGICNDFFGDSEISADLVLENFVAVGNNVENGGTDQVPLGWELRSEAFEPRVNLNLLSEVVTNDEAHATTNGGDVITTGAAAAVTTDFQTVLVEDQTSSLLCVDSALQRSEWEAESILKETLAQYAEIGDVQTAVSMYMVLRSSLGHARAAHLVDEATFEFWVLSYLDLLQRFQLYNNSAMLIKACPLIMINQLSHQSTSYLSNCTKCSKALSRPQGSWYCERCKRTPNLCVLCRRIVRGLFAWCQGCSHGGHLKCLRKWYGENTLCPTGCGHHCEYQ